MDKIKSEPILDVYNPILKCRVIIDKGNWTDHIVPNHPKVEGYLDTLIKQVLSSKGGIKCDYYELRGDPTNILIYAHCGHFQPLHFFLKLAIKKAKTVAFVKTIYPVLDIKTEGVQNYGSH